MTQNILVFTQDLSPEQHTLLRDATVNVAEWMRKCTNGELTLSVKILPAVRPNYNVGRLVDTNHNNGKEISYLNNIPVQVDCNAIEIATGIKYQVVYMVYNPNGLPATLFPHTAIAFNGRAFSSWPVNFPLVNTADLATTAYFFAHELMHHWYKQANLSGANLVDDVHQHAGIDSPQGNYSEIVMKLKPWWKDICVQSVTPPPVPTPWKPGKLQAFKQGDPRWQHVYIGIMPNGGTLKQIGCTTTCIAIASSWYTPTLNPAEVANKVKYTVDGLILWNSCIFQNFKFEWRAYSREDAKIKAYLKDPKKTVLLRLLTQFGTHWVFATGKSIWGGYNIIDPLRGDKTTTRRYGDIITGAAYFTNY